MEIHQAKEIIQEKNEQNMYIVKLSFLLTGRHLLTIVNLDKY